MTGRVFWPVISFAYFLLGRCVRADAAAVFAALLELGLLSTFAAAEAAFELVTSLFDIVSPPFTVLAVVAMETSVWMPTSTKHLT